MRQERRPSSAAKRLSLRVFTEGSKTEPLYLTHWSRRYRDRVIVSVAEFHGTPLSLVESAISEFQDDARTAKRGRGDAFDQYWCVFDIDVHPHVMEAVQLAAQHGIEVAYSNPCIELWFVLHFRDQNAFIERGNVQRLSKELLGCEKSLEPRALDALVRLHDDAVVRAQALDEKHLGDGSPLGSNPSSNVCKLIDVIRNA